MDAIPRKEYVMLVDGVPVTGVYADDAAQAREQLEARRGLGRKVALMARWRAQGRPVRLGGQGQRVEYEAI